MHTNMLIVAAALSNDDLLARLRSLARTEREASAELVAHRRIHGANRSYRNEELRREYVRTLKAALDRRRGADVG